MLSRNCESLKVFVLIYYGVCIMFFFESDNDSVGAAAAEQDPKAEFQIAAETLADRINGFVDAQPSELERIFGKEACAYRKYKYKCHIPNFRLS